MEIRAVKTEADYSAALVEIERLWGAEIDTPNGDRLDVLITLIDTYEAKHHPIYPPSPPQPFSSRWKPGASRQKIWSPISGAVPGCGRCSIASVP